MGTEDEGVLRLARYMRKMQQPDVAQEVERDRLREETTTGKVRQRAIDAASSTNGHIAA